jgi:hypothetical protein
MELYMPINVKHKPKGIMKNGVFWDVAPCRSCEFNRRFGGMYRLHLQGRIRRIRFIGRHITEEGILHSHRRENLNSYLMVYCYTSM